MEFMTPILEWLKLGLLVALIMPKLHLLEMVAEKIGHPSVRAQIEQFQANASEKYQMVQSMVVAKGNAMMAPKTGEQKKLA
jgi:hypothetical protein